LSRLRNVNQTRTIGLRDKEKGPQKKKKVGVHFPFSRDGEKENRASMRKAGSCLPNLICFKGKGQKGNSTARSFVASLSPSPLKVIPFKMGRSCRNLEREDRYKLRTTSESKSAHHVRAGDLIDLQQKTIITSKEAQHGERQKQLNRR